MAIVSSFITIDFVTSHHPMYTYTKQNPKRIQLTDLRYDISASETDFC